MRLYRGDDGSPLQFPGFFASTRSAAAQYATFSRGGRMRVFEFEPQRTLVLYAESESYDLLFEQAREAECDSICWKNFEVSYDQWVVLDPEHLVELDE